MSGWIIPQEGGDCKRNSGRGEVMDIKDIRDKKDLWPGLGGRQRGGLISTGFCSAAARKRASTAAALARESARP